MNKHGGYFGTDVNKVVDFSVNVNPLGPSHLVIEKLKESLGDIVRYPEIDGETGRKLLSKSLDIDTREIILGNGATELIYSYAKALKPQKVLIVEPTFTEYRRALEVNGSSVYEFITDENDDFEINIDALLSKIQEVKPDLVVICNPNNPTGTLTQKENLKSILDVLKKMQSYLFIDESFIDFIEEASCKSLIREYPLFILRSMTKFYAIPGLRLGYGLGHIDLISKLNRVKEPWTLNSLALQSLPVLLEDKDYKEKTLKWFNQEKQFLFNELSKLNNLRVFKSNSNFFLCKFLRGNVGDLKKNLLEQGIYIRTCNDFKGLDDKYFRIAIRTHEENLMLINKLRNTKIQGGY